MRTYCITGPFFLIVVGALDAESALALAREGSQYVTGWHVLGLSDGDLNVQDITGVAGVIEGWSG